MILTEIYEKFNGLDIFEKRQVTDEYIEVVFLNKQIDECNRILTGILGPAIKPAGAKPSKDVKRFAEKYGGIYNNQTLYKKDFDDETVLAMLWPWQDGVHTTFKISLKKK